MQIFAKEWVEYPFNLIALAGTAITKESLFCNAITNTQCERNLNHNSPQIDILSAPVAKQME